MADNRIKLDEDNNFNLNVIGLFKQIYKSKYVNDVLREHFLKNPMPKGLDIDYKKHKFIFKS